MILSRQDIECLIPMLSKAAENESALYKLGLSITNSIAVESLYATIELLLSKFFDDYCEDLILEFSINPTGRDFEKDPIKITIGSVETKITSQESLIDFLYKNQKTK